MTSLHGPAAQQYVGTCPTCGKLRYSDRSTARRAARALYPHTALRAYRCGTWWHIGHTAGWRKRGAA
jgi:hypothetical protein